MRALDDCEHALCARRVRRVHPHTRAWPPPGLLHPRAQVVTRRYMRAVIVKRVAPTRHAPDVPPRRGARRTGTHVVVETDVGDEPLLEVHLRGRHRAHASPAARRGTVIIDPQLHLRVTEAWLLPPRPNGTRTNPRVGFG